MKRILSSLLVAALVVLMTAGRLITAFKSGRPGSFLICRFVYHAFFLFVSTVFLRWGYLR